LLHKAMKSRQKLLNHCFNQGLTWKSQLKSNEKPQKASKSLPKLEIDP